MERSVSSLRYLRVVWLALIVTFAAWCVVSFRHDLARLSLAPLREAWDLVVVASMFSVANYALRALRWRWYLNRCGYLLPLRFSVLTYVAGIAFTLSPGKLGEVARARYYRRIGVSGATVVGMVLVERLMDVLAMVALASLATISFPRYYPLMWGAAIATLVGLAILVLVSWTEAPRWASRMPFVSARFANSLLAVTRMLASTRALLGPGGVAFGFLVAIVAWGLEGMGLGVLSGMAGPANVDMVTAVGIYAIAVLVGAISFLPGGLGSAETVMTALLASRGYSIADALLITIACRLATLWLGVMLGWTSIIVLRGAAGRLRTDI